MAEMGDHFWPSIYPGLAIGLLYGLYVGGIANVALGAIGGGAAAFVALAYFNSYFGQDGFLPLAALLTLSLSGAFGLVRFGQRFASAT